MTVRFLILAVLVVAQAAQAAGPALIVQSEPDETTRRQVEADATSARTRIEAYFGKPYRSPLLVRIIPDRTRFSTSLGPDWAEALGQCWVVGVGDAGGLLLLSPAAWKAQACEHDGADAREVGEIVAHELVHAYHGQYNPTRDFTGMDDAGWFVEGLAVLVSGQYEQDQKQRAVEAVNKGELPKALASAWSGPYRYGVCGSMVAFIEARWGKAKLVQMLGMTTQPQLLGALGMDEATFLRDWQDWLLRGR